MKVRIQNPLRIALKIIVAFLIFAWPYSQVSVSAAEQPILERDITYTTVDGKI